MQFKANQYKNVILISIKGQRYMKVSMWWWTENPVNLEPLGQ